MYPGSLTENVCRLVSLVSTAVAVESACYFKVEVLALSLQCDLLEGSLESTTTPACLNRNSHFTGQSSR